jgi:dipeptidyl-peptidase 4
MYTAGSNHVRRSGSRIIFLSIVLLFIALSISAQRRGGIKWADDGNSYFQLENNELIRHILPGNETDTVISKDKLIPAGSTDPLKISFYAFSNDQRKVLLFTNTKKVWRLNTKGDYWILDMKTGEMNQLGKSLPPSSLMFAKFSPDCMSVAYVSGNNIYVEDLGKARIKALTTNGSVTLINGTFDWVYEEEFYCRDGFRWSPDSKSIAYWQLDASAIKKFYMINNTDSIYSRPVPLEYPVAGEKPSFCRVGIINIADGKTTWMKIPGEPDQNYIIRAEFIGSSGELLINQLNRYQNCSKLFVCNPKTGTPKLISEDIDEAWVDVFFTKNPYSVDFTNDYTWLDNGKSILWASEKSGWQQLYKISLADGTETNITNCDFDVIDFKGVDQAGGRIYFTASPGNATRKYLYQARLDGTGNAELLTPATLAGTHDYSISPGGRFATHSFSNHFTRPSQELISLPDHKPLNETESIVARLDKLTTTSLTEFIKVKTSDSVEMDGWLVKPKDFDPGRKYPVVFFVYTEPAGTTVSDVFGVSDNDLYSGDMSEDGYIYVSFDNRGTPAPKGRAWRKSIYKQIGQINIRDQAMAAKEVLKWDFADPERVAVWGWSGGGSATLGLMFQYPEIYKTGIAIAPVANLLTYDNIYQERYMGLPQENMEAYTVGSPVTHARNLTGNLLYIHGTGDDNVHYQNAEMLVNELIKYNKQFQIMPYPNRTHGISEGEGTREHLQTLYTNYLKRYCPPGPK